MFLPPGIFNQYVIVSAELLVSALLLAGLFLKKELFTALGASLALTIMTGAIRFHLPTPLGVEVNNDGGSLFAMACSVWLVASLLIYSKKRTLPLRVLQKEGIDPAPHCLL